MSCSNLLCSCAEKKLKKNLQLEMIKKLYIISVFTENKVTIAQGVVVDPISQKIHRFQLVRSL